MTGIRNPLHGLLRSCVVRVDIERAFSGTGYFVAPGRVLTCAHVTVFRNVAVDRVELLWSGLRASATVVARYPDLEAGSARTAFWPYPDVALLALDDDTFDGHPCVHLDRDEPSEWPTDRLFAYGHTKGEHDADAISETSVTLEYEGPLIEGEQRYFKLKHGDVLRGMSGGPVLNVRTGGVCAIVESRRTVGAIAGGFGVPVAAFLDDLEDGLADRAAAFHRADRRWRIAYARTAGVRPMYVHHSHVLLGGDAVVGRDAELTQLEAWLRDPGRPVFCLAGPGGQGKSALAWTALARAEKAAAVRVWHSFGLDTRHDVALAASIVGAVRGPMAPDLDLDDALAVLGELGSLVVLDQVDALFGASPALLDVLTPAHRTIADPRVEALIRRLAATEGVRLLLTARLRPAFLDDPVLAERCIAQELQPLDGLESAALWTGVGVPGSRADAVAATTLLRGNPLLINVAARKLAAESRELRDVRTWLQTRAGMLDDVLRQPQFQSAVLGGALAGIPSRTLDLVVALAASRRRLDLDDWRALAPHLEPLTDLGGLVAESIERGLVHRAADDRFELHELVADAALHLADLDRLKQIYRTLDERQGRRLYLPGMSSVGEYDDVMNLGSLDDLDADLGYLRCLLDRDLVRDAEHVFGERLYHGLRFRLGELRILERVVGQLRAAHVRAGTPVESAPHAELLANVAILDGRPDDALAVLGPEPGESGPEPSRTAELRSEALMLRGDAAAGYPAAQHAAYVTLQDYLLTLHADYTSFQMLAEKPYYDTTRAMIDHALSLRTLTSILTQLGCPRTALAVLSSAVELVESSDQTGIRSMVFEATGRLLLHLGELRAARAVCDIAMEAAEPMAVTEHMLSAAVLDLEIRACDPAQDVRADALDRLAVTTRTGFGLLARRCLALVDAGTEPEGDAVRAAAAWQLRTSVHSPAAPDDAGSVAEELNRLAPLHPRRRWMELRCLRERPWAGQAFPQFLREPVGRIVGDSGLALRGDPFPMDESSAEDSQYGLTAFDDLLAALPYAPTNRPLRRQLIEAASTPDQLWQVVAALVPLTEAQVDSAAVQLDMANCARLLGHFQDAAVLSDSGLRAHSTFSRTIFQMSTPEPVRLPLILGFAFDVLELGTPAEQAIEAIRTGLQGAPLLPRGFGNQPRLKLLGAKDEGDYASAATFAAEMSEMQMVGGHYVSLEKHSTDWWIVEIVTEALASRQRRRRRRVAAAADEAARELIGAVGLIAGHAQRRQEMETAAQALLR